MPFIVTYNLGAVYIRKKHSQPPKSGVDIEEVSGIQNAKLYSYRELQVATENFSLANKVGEGGFGIVYKGKLKDDTLAAIKVLSAYSRQGAKQFLTELNVISEVEHENLVKLYGCCVEGDHRILVYPYLENNSLAQTLLGGSHSSIQFDWGTRRKICIGVARGLAYLHEEVRPHIIHRDIKASNILLDEDLTPKIADFGLAKLVPPNATHISTRVAGTVGYLAPEYALQGRVTRKADIYGFGILLLEIVCGRCNTNKKLPLADQYLLETVWNAYESGKLLELVDVSMGGDFDVEEASRYMKIGLLCTQDLPNTRPSMSNIVKLLTGEADVDDMKVSRPGLIAELMGIRENRKDMSNDALFTESSPENDTCLSSQDASCATMTFASIYDRS
ncbi:Protein kinase domain [Dillenia turbinata]|uniref:Protein kinase domain n=1 Tax=Dillenia turbinata TaxID=194707 RepID=A0AAN8W5Q6_9MAGN